MSSRLTFQIHGLTLPNPLVTASGCFANAQEAQAFQDTQLWGGLTTSAVTLEPRLGNPGVRVTETPAGMLNSVGLQNRGIDAFLAEELPLLRAANDVIILNVAGSEPADYLGVMRRAVPACKAGQIQAVELNLSCPNVKAGGMTIGTDPAAVGQIVADFKAHCPVPLWVKLTPNVTDIVSIALAAEAAGADAISLVNTFLGMDIDIETRRPVLGNNTGGLSGPAIRPLALRMVWQVAQAVEVPVVGLGGIETYRDVVAFMLAGASIVQLGSYNLRHPSGPAGLLAELDAWLAAHDIAHIQDLVGQLEPWP